MTGAALALKDRVPPMYVVGELNDVLVLKDRVPPLYVGATLMLRDRVPPVYVGAALTTLALAERLVDKAGERYPPVIVPPETRTALFVGEIGEDAAKPVP